MRIATAVILHIMLKYNTHFITLSLFIFTVRFIIIESNHVIYFHGLFRIVYLMWHMRVYMKKHYIDLEFKYKTNTCRN